MFGIFLIVFLFVVLLWTYYSSFTKKKRMESSGPAESPRTPVRNKYASHLFQRKRLVCSTPNNVTASHFSFNENASVIDEVDESSSGGFSDSMNITVVVPISEGCSSPDSGLVQMINDDYFDSVLEETLKEALEEDFPDSYLRNSSGKITYVTKSDSMVSAGTNTNESYRTKDSIKCKQELDFYVVSEDSSEVGSDWLIQPNQTFIDSDSSQIEEIEHVNCNLPESSTVDYKQCDHLAEEIEHVNCNLPESSTVDYKQCDHLAVDLKTTQTNVTTSEFNPIKTAVDDLKTLCPNNDNTANNISVKGSDNSVEPFSKRTCNNTIEMNNNAIDCERNRVCLRCDRLTDTKSEQCLNTNCGGKLTENEHHEENFDNPVEISVTPTNRCIISFQTPEKFGVTADNTCETYPGTSKREVDSLESGNSSDILEYKVNDEKGPCTSKESALINKNTFMKLELVRINCSLSSVDAIDKASAGSTDIKNDLLSKSDVINISSTVDTVSRENSDNTVLSKSFARSTNDKAGECFKDGNVATFVSNKNVYSEVKTPESERDNSYGTSASSANDQIKNRDTDKRKSFEKDETVERLQKSRNFKDEMSRDIAFDEINLTVTEEDVYYSRKDEISICFDAKSDTLRTLNLAQPSENMAEGVCTSKTESFATVKRREERAEEPPPAKRKKWDTSSKPSEIPLEVFVSDNAYENADNNDPKWQVFKNLTADQFRYKCIRATWHNPRVPKVNLNLSAYNWRARNGLPPLQVETQVMPYCLPVGGNVEDIFTKARDHAQDIFLQKLKSLEAKRDQFYNEADERYHYALWRLGPDRRQKCYSDYRRELESVQSDYSSYYRSLQVCLEERISAIDRAAEEVNTVCGFYIGLGNRDEPPQTYLSPWQLCCWYDREDTLNKYEIIYNSDGEHF